MRRALSLVLAALVLGGCAGVVGIDLVAGGYSVERYTDYGSIHLLQVTNPSEHTVSRVVIHAWCEEDQLESLRHEFESAETRLGAGETLASIELRHKSGFPYFTGWKVSCRFTAVNAAWPAEINAGGVTFP